MFLCEVIEDGHPILIVTASDIAGVLRRNSITTSNISEWISSVDSRDGRLMAYYKAISGV